MSLNSCAVIGGNLAFGWNDRQIELSGAVLRRHCRCAECRYQSLTGNAAATSDEVDIVAGSPLGYGIQLHFSDGHIRGVFPWTYLLEIADASSPSD